MVPTPVSPDTSPTPPPPTPPPAARPAGTRIAFFLLVAGLVAVIGFITWQGTLRARTDVAPATGAMKDDGSVTIAVDGMSCVGCAGAVESTLEEVPGVAEATVDYDHRTARIVLSDPSVQPAQLVAAVEQAGYKARIER